MSFKTLALTTAAILGASSAAQAQAAPTWATTPTTAEVAAAYPAKARAAGVGGSASLTCTLDRDLRTRQCAVLEETPTGYGFGSAAKTVAQGLRAERTDEIHARTEVRVPVTFAPEVLSGTARTVRSPAWVRIPTAGDFQATFPQAANGVNFVRVALACLATDDGGLSGCKVDREEPAGQGYGAAALALAPKFKVAAWSMDGQPTYGANVRVLIRYELTQVAQAAH